jgi:two-component system cell cycle response regulator
MTQALRRVLLIDDDRGQARIVEAAFSKFVGERFELLWSSTYEDGLHALREGGFTACLLDYQLGPRDGLELLREAVRAGVTTPVIFLTSETSNEVDTEALNAGAMDYLVKFEISPRGLERSLRYALRLNETLSELRRLATRDMLTTLFNRREGLRLLEREVERVRQHGGVVSALLVDIDNFKGVNDAHGHDAGDRVLAAVAQQIRFSVRVVDVVVRWGGDEFAVWLPEQDAVAARRSAEGILVAVRALGCSVSIGVAQWNAQRSDATDLLVAADRALYEAKAAGRNRVA